MIDSAELIKKVRFPRQLVAFSMVATQAVTFVVMIAILIVLSLVFVPEARTTVWAAIPLAVLFAGARRGARAARRLPERALPRRRAHPHRGAPAVVLPDADPLVGRDAAREGAQPPRAARRAALGQPVAPPIFAVRDALWSGSLPRLADVVYLASPPVLALVLGALVFRAVDDRIASSDLRSRFTRHARSGRRRPTARRAARRRPAGRRLAERLQLDPGQHRRAEQRRR